MLPISPATVCVVAMPWTIGLANGGKRRKHVSWIVLISRTRANVRLIWPGISALNATIKRTIHECATIGTRYVSLKEAYSTPIELR